MFDKKVLHFTLAFSVFKGNVLSCSAFSRTQHSFNKLGKNRISLSQKNKFIDSECPDVYMKQ